jgi:hypothetical protein
MKKALLLLVLPLLALLTGCWTFFEPVNPFSHGKWKYTGVYAPVNYDVAWEIIRNNLPEWDIENENKPNGRLETQWRFVAPNRLRAEVRVARKKDDSGNEGVMIGLRVLRQRTRDIYTPLRENYEKWKYIAPDERWEKLLLLRFDDALRRIMRGAPAPPVEGGGEGAPAETP